MFLETNLVFGCLTSLCVCIYMEKNKIFPSIQYFVFSMFSDGYSQPLRENEYVNRASQLASQHHWKSSLITAMLLSNFTLNNSWRYIPLFISSVHRILGHGGEEKTIRNMKTVISNSSMISENVSLRIRRGIDERCPARATHTAIITLRCL